MLTLEEIAQTRDWLTFGRRLSGAMECAQEHGFEKSEHVLIEVAKRRGQSRSGVRNIVLAARFVERNFDPVPQDGEGLPLSSLSRLSAAKGSPEEISMTLEYLVSGKIKVRDLESKIKEMNQRALQRISGVVAGRPGREGGRNRARAFEAELQSYLSENLASLFGPKAALLDGARLTPIPTDLLVTRGDSPLVGIIIQAPREMRHPRVLLETLGIANLARNAIAEVWIVTSPDWRPHVKGVASVADELSIRNIRLFVFETGNGVEPALLEVPEPISNDPMSDRRLA